ncbi:hypothetical protein M885DRAFT_526667, partial [Pelagophyceae sp. CCMP2097]
SPCSRAQRWKQPWGRCQEEARGAATSAIAGRGGSAMRVHRLDPQPQCSDPQPQSALRRRLTALGRRGLEGRCDARRLSSRESSRRCIAVHAQDFQVAGTMRKGRELLSKSRFRTFVPRFGPTRGTRGRAWTRGRADARAASRPHSVPRACWRDHVRC